MKNKIISLLLAMVFVFTAVTAFSTTAFASGASLTVAKSSDEGSTLKVTVGVSEARKIMALGVSLSYDSTILRFESVEIAGVAKTAGMSVFASTAGSSLRLMFDESNSGNSVTGSGAVCVVTFTKLSTVKNGTKADFTASAIDSLTYGENDESLTISDGSASITLSVAETTTKKPSSSSTNKTTTAKATTTKKVTTTKKATTTKASTTVKPVESPTLLGVTTTALEETTTEETTVEEVTTEYESYSYQASVEDETEDDSEDKSENIKKIVLIVIIVVCLAAAVAIYFTKRR